MASGVLLPAVFYLLCICRKQCAPGRLLLALCFAAGALRMGAELRPNPLEARLEREGAIPYARAEGRIVRVSEKNGFCSVLLSDATVYAGGRTYRQKRLMVSAPEGGFEESARLKAMGKLELYKEARNPGQFDARLYYRSQKIFCVLKAREAEGEDGEAPLFYHQAQSFKRAAGLAVEAVFGPKDQGIYRAVLLGDRSMLPEEDEKLFEDSGIAHILAVSGLHVSLIGMGLFGLLRKAGAGFAGAGLCSGAALVFYAGVTGFGPSVYRAVFMLLCSFAAMQLGRTYDLLSAMALSLLLLSCDSPLLLTSGGLQLSYGAVAAIGLRAQLKKDREKELRREKGPEEGENEKKGAPSGNGARGSAGALFAGLKGSLGESLGVSFAVQLATLPALLYHFFSFPPWGIFLNLLVLPLMSYAAASGILAAGLWMLGGLLADLFPAFPGGVFAEALRWAACASAGPGHYILALYRMLCRVSLSLPFSSILAGRPEWWQTAVYYSALAWYLGNRGGRKPGSRLKRGVWAALAALFLFIRPVRGLDIWFMDVGQGDGVLLRTNDAAILSDCGSSQDKSVGKNRLVPFLKSQGVGHLNFILVSHGDADHMNGIIWLLEEETGITADCLVLPAAGRGQEVYGKLEMLARAKGMQVYYMARGGRIKAGELVLTCLHPQEETQIPQETADWTENADLAIRRSGSESGTKDRNGHSLVFSVEYGSFRMLLTGDIGADEERGLLKAGLGGEDSKGAVSILKAAHHGSAGSSCGEFLEAIRPAAAILSYGEGNSYGHPAGETVKRLDRQGCSLWHTARSGAIRARTDGKTMRISGWLAVGRRRLSGFVVTVQPPG